MRSPHQEEPMTALETEAAPATPPHRPWTRWLYPTLAVTGIAVGIFVIAAGAYIALREHRLGRELSSRVEAV